MNEEKFTGLADIYAKFRPTYPKDFIDYLYSDVGFTDKSVIADIGSGTGILTRLLLMQNNKIISVEPNDDMRQTAEKELAVFENYVPVKATAENTSLDDASIDFITVAQAFHWFDRIKFKTECKRILKPGGKVVLVWNCRDMASELVMENDRIIRQFCPKFTGFASGHRGGGIPEDYADFFENSKDGVCEYKTFRNDLLFDEENFIGRNLSSSYSLKKEDENYDAYIEALKNLFHKYSSNGQVCMPNIAQSYVGYVGKV